MRNLFNGMNVLATSGLAAAALALAPAPAAALDPSYSGSWFNPPEAGSGLNL